MSQLFETLAIGDEILTGKISDSNSTFVGHELLKLAVALSRQTVVADTNEAIISAVEDSSRRADVLICFGGLGPTSDDRTAAALCELLGGDLVEHKASKDRLIKYYKSRGRKITEHALKQVLYPERTTPIPNPVGLAPGFQCEVGGCTFYFLPGVPEEMQAMFSTHVFGQLKRGLGSSARTRLQFFTWKCLGIAESQLQDILAPIEAKLPDGYWLGYRTTYPENHITLYAESSEKNSQVFERCKKIIATTLKRWVYTDENESLEQVVARLIKEEKKSLVLVESCTGGLVSHRLSQVQGASKWLWGAYVSYQVAAKAKMLQLHLKSSASAVSKECARDLARQALVQSGCTIAASIVGYMGPEGGTRTDPVGTIYVCVEGNKRKTEKRIVLPKRSRVFNQWAASTYLLDMLRQHLN